MLEGRSTITRKQFAGGIEDGAGVSSLGSDASSGSDHASAIGGDNVGICACWCLWSAVGNGRAAVIFVIFVCLDAAAELCHLEGAADCR